jgi:hypothetical protein
MMMIFRRTAELLSLLCSDYPACTLTQLWGFHLPPVALCNHDLLIAPSVEFLRVFLCISLSWKPNLREFSVTDKRPITFSEVYLVGVRSSIRLQFFTFNISWPAPRQNMATPFIIPQFSPTTLFRPSLQHWDSPCYRYPPVCKFGMRNQEHFNSPWSVMPSFVMIYKVW